MTKRLMCGKMIHPVGVDEVLELKIGIDFGTARMRAFTEGGGIVVSEPSVIALEAASGEVEAIGSDALIMLGREPGVFTVSRPVRDGNIVDFDLAERMLAIYIKRICGNRMFKPTVIASVPVGMTELEKRTVLDAIIRAGVGRACLIESPLAAALGAGIMLDKPCGTLAVDIGAGTTDAAVVTMGNIASSYSEKVGGDLLDRSLIEYLRIERDIEIGEPTAEDIKRSLGAAVRRDTEIAAVARGKSLKDGLPLYFEISSDEVYEAFEPALMKIGDTVMRVLDMTSPELVKDVSDNGMLLAGGTSQLYGMERMLMERTGIKATAVFEAPLAIVKGTGAALRDIEYLRQNGYKFMTAGDGL